MMENFDNDHSLRSQKPAYDYEQQPQQSQQPQQGYYPPGNGDNDQKQPYQQPPVPQVKSLEEELWETTPAFTKVGYVLLGIFLPFIGMFVLYFANRKQNLSQIKPALLFYSVGSIIGIFFQFMIWAVLAIVF